MSNSFRFGVIGIDHRHAFGMSEHLINAGAEMVGWSTIGTPETLEGFAKRFPDAPRISQDDLLAHDVDLMVHSGL